MTTQPTHTWKWEESPNGLRVDLVEGLRIVLSCTPANKPSDKDAAHITTRMNACAGIPTDDLHRIPEWREYFYATKTSRVEAALAKAGLK